MVEYYCKGKKRGDSCGVKRVQGAHERRALFRGSAGMTELARRGPANLRVGFATASRTYCEGAGVEQAQNPNPKKRNAKV